MSCPLTASAQSQFDVWDTDTGLPQNSVQAILQTRDGYLWFTTFDGLVRFDGAQFTVFNSGNSPGLKSNRFTVLCEDRDGVLWAGTEDAGLARYADGVFTGYAVADGLPANRVLQIQNDPGPRGHLLVRTSAGIIRWPEKEPLPTHTYEDDPLTRFRYVDRDGVVWSYGGSNLHKTEDGVETVYTTADGLTSARITSLFGAREGSLWIATRDAGVQRLKDGVFRTYTKRDGLPDWVQTFYEDRGGHLWMGTADEGLVRLSHAHDDGRYNAAATGERVSRYTTAQGLSGNSIRSIYEDSEGSLWVGTAASGLNRLRRQIITTYTQRDGLGSDNVYPIYQDRAGNVWMGTWPRGLSVYRDGKFTHYTREDGLPVGNLVTALAEDREGRLWVGGYSGACWFEDGKFNAFPQKLALQGGGITAILQDRAGGFWFGTEAAGLYRFSNGALSQLTTRDGLPSNNLHAIIEDRDGNIWVGTYGGLVKFAGDSFTVLTTKDGLAGDRVRSLDEDGDGAIWIGTYDSGLSRYKDGRMTSFTPREGLFNGGVFQILEDGRDNLWLTCNLGIYRVSRRELNDFAEGKVRTITSVPYGKPDGMLNVECNGGTQPAGIRARDGRLWFPTQAGVAVVDPGAVMTNSAPPPVVIESALVDREAKDLRRPLRIEPGQTQLEIHYTGLSFIKPERVRFRYRLAGVDRDWVEAGDRRTAYYSYLPPGTYIFTVVAANSDGVWDTRGRSLQLVVLPPFWRTWWFIALAVLSVAGSAALLYTRRVSLLKRAHGARQAAQEAFTRQLIESQESERKRIAGELHDGLGQSLILIKNHALVGLDIPESEGIARGEFREISEATSQAINEIKEIAYDLRPYQLDRLGLTKALAALLKKVSASSAVEFSADIDRLDGVFSKESEIHLYRIVQESLNNIIKHSGAERASVLIKRDGRGLHVRIEDNGRGFNPAADDAGEADSQRGFGLVGISERAHMLGGEYAIHSTPGAGTVVTLRLNSQENRHGR